MLCIVCVACSTFWKDAGERESAMFNEKMAARSVANMCIHWDLLRPFNYVLVSCHSHTCNVTVKRLQASTILLNMLSFLRHLFKLYYKCKGSFSKNSHFLLLLKWPACAFQIEAPELDQSVSGDVVLQKWDNLWSTSTHHSAYSAF